MSGEKPLNMARIYDAIRRAPKPESVLVPIHPTHLRDHAFALGLVLVAEGEYVMVSK